MTAKTILIADDAPEIIDMFRLFLDPQTYRVLEASNGREAWALLNTEKIDLALIDLMMPEMDGLQLISRIRAAYNLPVIVVSARSGEMDKVTALGLGADDYIPKPFSPMEAVARINAQLRRYYELNPSGSASLRESDRFPGTDTLTGPGRMPGSNRLPGRITAVGPAVLNHDTCVLELEGKEIFLSATEYRLLGLLMEAPGRVYTKRQIYETVWEDEYWDDGNTVMVQISRLRDKLGDSSRAPRWIRTVKGLGYRFARKEEVNEKDT